MRDDRDESADGEPSDPAPSAEYDRLPQEVKDSIRARERDEAVRDAARIERARRRAKMTAIGGGIASFVLSFPLGSSGLLFHLAYAAVGAVASWWIAARRLGQAAGTLIWGGFAFALFIAGTVLGALEPQIFLAFFALLLYVVAGSLVAFAAEEERSVTESF
jgi:hypothetical protein